MANPGQSLPTLTGVPPNIQRELEQLRGMVYTLQTQLNALTTLNTQLTARVVALEAA